MFRVQSGGRMIRSNKTQPSKDQAAPSVADTPPAEVTPAPTPRPVVISNAMRPTSSPSDVLHVTPEEARQMFRRGDTPQALSVDGSLNLSGSAWLRTLPAWLRCTALMVDDCPNLSVLPSDLHAEKLSARRCPNVLELDGRISIRESINLTGSGLRSINADLHATRLQVAQCRSLTRLGGMISVAHLDVRGCTSLTTIDASIHVTQTLEVADSGLKAMPPHIRAGLRWNGVPVDARVAFTPELLSGREIMGIRNVQRRRVLLERIGIEKFLADVGGLVLDRDQDAGGERTLIRVPFDDDEDLVAVLVKCPSTGGSYALRVPPHMRSCREAVAWTAGLNVNEYHPVQER